MQAALALGCVFLSSRPVRRCLGPEGCRHLCSSLSEAVTSQSDTDGRPGRWLSLSNFHKRCLCAEAQAPRPYGAQGRQQRTSPAVSCRTVAARATHISGRGFNLSGKGCQPQAVLISFWANLWSLREPEEGLPSVPLLMKGLCLGVQV